MELVELIRGAQDAMDRGDYAYAAAACSHAIETYPSCFSAHRMLAEAYLEQGQSDSAIGHFERTLSIDPLNVLAHLGLGVVAEEKREMNDAYASYLHAWEINPALDQVRDELVRLRGLLGGGERLHPTRPGLAGIYARGGQFGRAAAEWRAVLMVEPENRRARTSLAEVLWRSGDDAQATAMCREALEEFAENARALAMLAEMEQRRGSSTAEAMIERYQAVDPLAEIATLLSEWRDGIDVGFLRCESASLPDFDPSTVAHVAVPAEAAAQASMASGLAGGHFAAPDLWDTLIRDFSGDPEVPDGAAPTATDVQPFSWLDEGSSAPSPAVEPFSLDALIEQHQVTSGDPPMEFMQSKRGPSTDQLSIEDEIDAFATDATPFAPPEEAPPAVAAVAPASPVAPVPTPEAPPAAMMAPAASPFVSADGRVDLTVGWDDLDRQLQEATPSFVNSAEMDALVAQLGVDGIAPFEMDAAPFDESAWAPFTADDVAETVPAQPTRGRADQPPAPLVSSAPEPVAQVPNSFSDTPALVEEDALDLGWDLDEELVSSIPQPQSSGYTEMLRHVDIELPQEIEVDPEIDPFANPDSAGTPLAFEDLLAVTSRDGTAPLRSRAEHHESIPAESSDPVDERFALQSVEQPSATNGVEPDLSLEESPLGLEELLRDSAVAEHGDLDWPAVAGPEGEAPERWHPAAHQSGAVLGESNQTDFVAELEGLEDLQPFSIDDMAGSAGVGDTAVDFSDINEAPFDAAAIAQLGAPEQPSAFEVDDIAPANDGPVTDSEAAALDDASASPWEAAALAEEDSPEQVLPVAAAARGRDVGGLGVPPGGVAWPAFVNHTSELIDRSLSGGNLFARLREAKSGAISAGLLTVDRSIRALRVPVGLPQLAEEQVQVFSVPAAERGSETLTSGPRHSSMTESERIDLMAMRVQLIEDVSSAGEIAERLEAAVLHGLNDPLALRVLGEAYLKLGRTEQAAAQFRQAMLARHRTR